MLALVARVDANLSEGLARATVAFAEFVVPGTPIKTGRARTGWRGGRNVAPRGEIFGGSYGGDGGVVNRVAGVVAGIRHTETAYVSNDVPYIGILDDGSSDQAPNGFTEQAVQAVEVRIDEFIDPLRGVV